jgi:hypothetical protein
MPSSSTELHCSADDTRPDLRLRANRRTDLIQMNFLSGGASHSLLGGGSCLHSSTRVNGVQQGLGWTPSFAAMVCISCLSRAHTPMFSAAGATHRPTDRRALSGQPPNCRCWCRKQNGLGAPHKPRYRGEGDAIPLQTGGYGCEGGNPASLEPLTDCAISATGPFNKGDSIQRFSSQNICGGRSSAKARVTPVDTPPPVPWFVGRPLHPGVCSFTVVGVCAGTGLCTVLMRKP